MSKEIPRGLDLLRSGLGLNLKLRGTFTNLAALTAAGLTPAKYPNSFVHLTAGGTGAVQCIAYSDGTNWKQIAIGANCV